MFSQVSVILSTGMGGRCVGMSTRGGSDIPEGRRYTRGRGWICIPPPGMGPEIPTPLVLTPSDGHQNTYGCQRAGTQTTGMLCDICSYSRNKLSYYLLFYLYLGVFIFRIDKHNRGF